MSIHASTGKIHRVNFNKSTAASHVVKAAVSGKKIRVLAVHLQAAGAVTITIEDEDGNDLDGPCSTADTGGFVEPFSDGGWAETPASKGLNCRLSDAVQVGGVFVLQEVE